MKSEAEELSELSKKQALALDAAAYIKMSKEKWVAYDWRLERISHLRNPA
jgi:hypothetical protein